MAPPSINELGNKNPLRPKPAETIPMKTKIESLTKWRILTLKISTSLDSFLSSNCTFFFLNRF